MGGNLPVHDSLGPDERVEKELLEQNHRETVVSAVDM